MIAPQEKVSPVLLEICNRPANTFVKHIFDGLPALEQNKVKSVVAAVTDSNLTTAVRPFSFNGKIVHELYFDTDKLLFFLKDEKVGAVVSAMIIASLASEKRMPLSSQALMTHAKLILRAANRLKYGRQVSAFLRRLKSLEDQWRNETNGQ